MTVASDVEVSIDKMLLSLHVMDANIIEAMKAINIFPAYVFDECAYVTESPKWRLIDSKLFSTASLWRMHLIASEGCISVSLTMTKSRHCQAVTGYAPYLPEG